MNRSPSAASAPFAGNALRCTKGFWSRLRLGSMLPFVLGACVLLPATSSALQAKEISMQDNQGQYQPYKPGMKLPDGVYPPVQGYTHADLLEAAAKPVEAILKADGVDPTLTKETLFALAAKFNEQLEEKLVEYRLAKLDQETKDDATERTKLFDQVAESLGAMAMQATTQSFRGSPLLNKSNDYLARLSRSAGDGVYELVVTLGKAKS
ncbi:hypothetical protein ACIPZF_20750 [Pseudomonas sp. NPDC089752]|uniref:hypothetical protein n=1 Tax=Pseudomonas sp. NPDC089752 TaxID=3364472 RepID=UPI00380EB27C